jgi:Fe-S-cluster containining protein
MSDESGSDVSQPWYKDGLRFTCTGCGNCCTGDPGFVWVNRQEIKALADGLGLDVVAFEAQFVRHVGIRRSLVERANGDCIFFDPINRRCEVYELRPRQCRTWPFWNTNLRTPESWAETCQACPGSGRGKLYNLGEISAQAELFHL